MNRRSFLASVAAAPVVAKLPAPERDDGPAIQSQIDRIALAGGGLLYLPAGTYVLSPTEWFIVTEPDKR